MATDKQKIAMEEKLKARKEGKPITDGEALRRAGYSKSIQNKPKKVTGSKGWQELLAKYDEEPVMDKIYEEALDSKDKRNATANRKMLLELKGRFETKIRVNKLDEALEDLR